MEGSIPIYSSALQQNQGIHRQASSLPPLFLLFFYCADIIRAQYHRIRFAKFKIHIFSCYYGYIRLSMAYFIPLAITGFLVHKFTTVPCSSTVVNSKQLVMRRLMDADTRLCYEGMTSRVREMMSTLDLTSFFLFFIF